MQPESVVAWVITFAALAFALARSLRGQIFQPIVEDAGRAGGTVPDQDEQQPETDRAPPARQHLPALAAVVCATAAIRVALLVALHR
jgi:hypothetical protein